MVDLIGLRVGRRVLVEASLDDLHRVSREPRSRLGRVQELLVAEVGIEITESLCEQARNEVIARPWTERIHGPAGSHERRARASSEEVVRETAPQGTEILATPPDTLRRSGPAVR